MLLLLLIVGILSAAGIALYLFNKPHRDVQAAKSDYTLSSNDLVQEYLQNPYEANQKYLDESGNSKIIVVTGRVHSITRDLNNQLVVLLKEDHDPAGVSATFTETTNASAEKLSIGQTIAIKGVIRAGAGYDEDLDLYEDVILEKSDVFKFNKQESK